MADEAPSWIREACYMSYISTGSLLIKILNALPIWYVIDPVGSEIIFVQFVSSCFNNGSVKFGGFVLYFRW